MSSPPLPVLFPSHSLFVTLMQMWTALLSPLGRQMHNVYVIEYLYFSRFPISSSCPPPQVYFRFVYGLIDEARDFFKLKKYIPSVLLPSPFYAR